MKNQHTLDVDLTLAIETGMSSGMANAISMQLALGEHVAVKHILAAASAFYTATIATILPPEAWPDVFATLQACIPEMREYRAQAQARHDALGPIVPRPADPDAN